MSRSTDPAEAPQLPTDLPRPALRLFVGGVCRRRLGGTLRQALCRVISPADRRLRLLSAWQFLIGRLSGCDEALLGVEHGIPSAPLLLRLAWTADTSVNEHHRALAQELDQAAPARMPLPVRFAWGEAGAPTADAGASGDFELRLQVVESETTWTLYCSYDRTLFHSDTIESWLDSYQALLEAGLADPARRVSGLPCLGIAQQEQLLRRLNDTDVPYPRDSCLHRLFEQQAAQSPAAVALQYGASCLSYRALDRRANRLAHHLMARVGGGNCLVGILLQRSLDLPVALLATLKAGCAYLPLDPELPESRLRQILDQAQVAALVTDQDAAAPLPAVAGQVIDLRSERAAVAARPATPPSSSAAAADLAYVIFTSGSTGVPKGVEITHRAIVNLLSAMAREPGFAADDVLLATTTVSFDIAALELFLPLMTGARVVIAEAGETRDGEALLRRLQRARATVMQATPSTWKLLVEAGFSGASLRRMLCGGEALPRELARQLLADGGELWNMYGPTETTVWSSCARISAADQTIGIGRMPIANTSFYILDRHDQPVPVGALGQLHIGGDGVARGYLGRPQRTAEVFIPDPFGGGRLYRTGDLALRRADGQVLLLGRMDRQIKLRGYRIEPGEIESALLRERRVAAAAVQCSAGPSGAPRLVAYYVETPGRPCTPAQLQTLLLRELPEYMVPTAWVPLAALPLTPNGKLDRLALPAPETAAPAAAAPPREPLEAALAAIWTEVLQYSPIGIHSDIFELGADSIQMFQIAARAKRADIKLSPRQLMQHRTIARLAASLKATA